MLWSSSASRSVVSAAFAQTAATYGQRRVCRSPVSKVSAQQLYISKETSRIRSMLSDGNIFTVAAEPVLWPRSLLSASSSPWSLAEYTASALMTTSRRVADLPRSIGKLIKGIDDTLPVNNIFTVDAESIRLPKLLHSQCL